jgi:predicted ArsR family transcriptional regulator
MRFLNMANTTTVTKEQRVLEALQATDRGLTGAQIEARFGVGNARSTVSALRMKGYAIYANQHTDTKGRTKTFYRLGTPSRKVVAAGYRALAAGLV